MRIEKITVEGFRAFNQKYTFALDNRLTIFLGPNGTGKTSLCDAIQWAIIGKLPEYSSVEASLEDVIINRNNPNREALVKIAFTDDGDRTEIQRRASSRNVWRPTKTGKLQLLTGKEETIKVAPETFRATIYLRQEALRKFIEEKPEKRKPVLSSLLGLEFIDALEKGVGEAVEIIHGNMEEMKEKLSDLQGEVEKYKEEYSVLEARKRSLRQKQKISSEQLEKMLEQPSIVLGAKKIYERLQQIGNSLNLTPPMKFKEDLPTVRIFLVELPRLIKEWKQKNSEKLDEFAKLEKKYEELRQRIEEFDEETIRNEIQKTEDELRSKKENLEIIDSFSRLIVAGEQFLKLKKPKKCPLCESKIDDLQTLLKQVVAKKEKLEKGKEAEELQLAIASLCEKMRTLNEKLEEFKKWKKEAAELDEKLESAELKTAKEIEESLLEISKDAELLVELNAISEKERELAEKRLPSKEDIANTRKKVEKLEYLYEMVRFLHERLRELTTSFISKRIDSLAPIINEYTKILSPHPIYSELRITYDGKGYWLQGVSKEGEKTFVQTLFSTGQLNEAAVLILLAMAKKAPHSFEFVILDDPSQSLDEDGKERLAKLLVKASESKQVIVSTMDTDFANFIRAYYPQAKVYEFIGYDNKKGPLVKGSG